MPVPGDILPKDPDSDLDYVMSWADWLQTGEGIAISTWPSPPAGVTTHDLANDTTTGTIWVSGGTVGELYAFTNRVVTDSSPPRTAERSFSLSIVER